MQREKLSDKFPIGSPLPSFSLPSTTGTIITDNYFKDAIASLVIFTCNHCPYVKGSELALYEILAEHIPQGLSVVAISANDPLQYPEDSFEMMKRKANDVALPYPYLFDETQEVARLFDAACTPECYLFDSDKKLCFHGPINDNPRYPEKVTTSHLATAIKASLNGEIPNPAFVNPIGCSIKWKQGS